MEEVLEVGKLVSDGEPPNQLKKTLTTAFGSAVRGKVVQLAEKALGPVGMLADLAIGWGHEKAEEYKKSRYYVAGIKALAEKDVPGFLFHETQINGGTVRIAVDASGKLSNPEAKPFVWTDAPNAEEPDLASVLAAARNKATSEVEGFRAASLAGLPARKEKYLSDLKAYGDSLRGNTQAGTGIGLPVGEPPVPDFSVKDHHKGLIGAAHDTIRDDLRKASTPEEPQIAQASPPPALAK